MNLYKGRVKVMFIDLIKEICSTHKKVAMFIDMDGTIVEYKIYGDEAKLIKAHENLLNEKPVLPIIDILKEINKIENIDLYILSLAKKTKIKEEKKIWLNEYMNFIPYNKWIILDKESGEYNSENRNYVKCNQMEKKLEEYDYVVLLDDDHKILKQTKENLKDRGEVFHISSALV